MDWTVTATVVGALNFMLLLLLWRSHAAAVIIGGADFAHFADLIHSKVAELVQYRSRESYPTASEIAHEAANRVCQELAPQLAARRMEPDVRYRAAISVNGRRVADLTLRTRPIIGEQVMLEIGALRSDSETIYPNEGEMLLAVWRVLAVSHLDSPVDQLVLDCESLPHQTLAKA